MLKVSHNLGDLPTMIRDEAEKAIAEEVVAECRKKGVKSVDDVTINLDAEMRSIGVRVDRIKRLVSGRIG